MYADARQARARGTTTTTDYANFIMACLTHDIGYVRGIVQGDEEDTYVADLCGAPGWQGDGAGEKGYWYGE
ncbi:hypothetical protein [Bradyrhizobium sp.]|uniref:hypothetical protein n=1 Tax=Bradyrhizobium sp. TaxID=376 RepID=UPI003BAFF848